MGPGGSDPPPACSVKHVGFVLAMFILLECSLLFLMFCVADEIFTPKQEAIPLSLLKAVNRL